MNLQQTYVAHVNIRPTTWTYFTRSTFICASLGGRIPESTDTRHPEEEEHSFVECLFRMSITFPIQDNLYVALFGP